MNTGVLLSYPIEGVDQFGKVFMDFPMGKEVDMVLRWGPFRLTNAMHLPCKTLYFHWPQAPI
jgi:hypothetical protein